MFFLIILIEWNTLRNSISDIVVKCKQLWYAIYYTLSKSKNAKDFRLFHSVKEISDLENAFGQYILYRNIIEELEPELKLYLAVHEEIFATVFDESLGQMLIRKNNLKLIVFRITEEKIIKWNE